MDPFLGMIVLFAGNFAPRGWAFCDGQLLNISQFSALFSILGTTYGGDGRSTFALPDLRGRVPVHPGHGPGLSNRRLGERGGAESANVQVNSSIGVEAQPHTHELQGESSQMDAQSTSVATVDTPTTGSSNVNVPTVPPYLGVNYIIALQGTFPSRS